MQSVGVLQPVVSLDLRCLLRQLHGLDLELVGLRRILLDRGGELPQRFRVSW
jgi:hypothetical protein